jgi:hypothetical protein
VFGVNVPEHLAEQIGAALAQKLLSRPIYEAVPEFAVEANVRPWHVIEDASGGVGRGRGQFHVASPSVIKNSTPVI